ncbi:MAG: F0F1 ATP synthase subunit B [Lactobacillaceae bacterium]|jgi:F-type H+-transporting ATPase subunit b|nr:F0F1 ATP synthase subunit B [Lactobacillaceae bacterium]
MNNFVGILATPIPYGSALYVLISFIVLLLLLKKFAWGPITKMMDQRAQQINSDLDDALKTKQDAQQLQQQAQNNLQSSQAQANALIEDARNRAADEASQTIASANKQADNILKQAQEDASQLKDDALDSAKDQITDLSLQVASQIISQKLDAKTNKKLVNDFISELEQKNK